MRIRGHGNWCGPGWTAGQYKDAANLTDEDRQVEAIDALDQACKEHDIGLHDHPERTNEINKKFIHTVRGMGVEGWLYSLAVGLLGPVQPGQYTKCRVEQSGSTMLSSKYWVTEWYDQQGEQEERLRTQTQ